MWDCEAYGPKGRTVGALCFMSGQLNKRTCADQDECRRLMAAERGRVFRRINELAAAGEEPGTYLAEEFARPDQLFSGDDEDSSG